MSTTQTVVDAGLAARIDAADAELKAAGLGLLLTAKQASAALGMHFRTLHRMIHRGDLAALKAGDTWRIRRRELARFLIINER